MKTPNYVQIVGLIKQDLIYIAANDTGGEMDPHGADQRGNPLGGLLFSKAFGTGNTFVQAIEWHKYVGCQSHSPFHSLVTFQLHGWWCLLLEGM